MFQPSTSRDPLLTRGGVSDSDGGESVEKHAYDYNSSVGELVYFTDIDEDQSFTPISEFTVVESVDANVLKLPGENQRFLFVEFSPDWKLVVTVTSDGFFSIWDATNEWVLVGSKRLHHDGRTLKCIAFDPYIKEAVLFCFDSGEIFRTSLRGPATSDDPGSSQDQGLFRTEQVYHCEGRAESCFDHFTFSPDRKTMVYYNLDGEFVAVRFPRQGEPEWISLSKEFVLKQDPKIYVSERSTLITAVMKSSEDRESTGERIETLFWLELDFEDTEANNNPVKFEGKGYLSGDAKYVVISSLATKHQSTCCQLDLYLAEGFKSNMNVKHSPIASKILTFTSTHPHLDFLEWNKFNFLNLEHEKTEPLIAIHQTNSVGNRLLLWHTNSNLLIYEVDLTLNKEARKFSEVKYCWSSDFKWLGVCSIGARMVGLVCVRSGVFVWAAHVPEISREDMGLSTLGFNPSRTKFMISLGKMIFYFEPSCLSTKPQKHPMHHGLSLSQASKPYNKHEIQELATWPKHVLFNVLLTGQGLQHPTWNFLLDVAISMHSKTMALICQKHNCQRFLFIVDYSKTLSRESLWLLVTSRWIRCFVGKDTSSLVKEIRGDESYKGISVFYCQNEESNNEQIVMLSSRDGVEMQVLDSELNELCAWTRIFDERCFSFKQSRDRRHVILLTDRHVVVIDLNKRMIANRVGYSFGLSQWWESLVDGVKLLGYSHYYSFDSQECHKEHKLFLQDRIQGLFDVSEDGETILIGWDNARSRSVVITPNKSEEQFRTEWDEAHESLCQCSMLTQNGKWLGFVDYKMLSGGDIVVCVVNTESNRQQRIWLGSDESFNKLVSLEPQLLANFFLQIDRIEEHLTILVLERTGTKANLKKFSLKLLNAGECERAHESLLNTTIQPITLDAYGEAHQPSTFNMRVTNISNFQRVWVEEGEDKLKQVIKRALDNKVKVSDVYRFCQDKEDDHTSLLMHALKKKKTAEVQLCLDFIKDGLFTFHSASAMVKDSFFEMLLSYNELIVPMLKMNSLTLKVAEVIVPAKVYQSHSVLSDVVFTSDTIFDPDEHFVNMANGPFGKTKSKMRFELANNQEEGLKVLSYVYFFYIANACKVGLNGIIRKLLMKDVALATFKTGLVRATVCWKWDKLWKQRCLRELYMYLVFLVLFTSYAICLGVLGDRLVHNKWIRLCISSLLGGVFVLAIRFSFDEYKQLKTYIKDGKEVFGSKVWGFKHYFWNSKWNLVDICSYFLVLVLIPIFHLLYIFGNNSKEPLFAMVAIESLLAWFKLWYYAQPFEQTSALVLLIRNVVHDCRPFLGLAFIILVGFSVALFVLFQCCLKPISMNVAKKGDDDDDDDDEGDLIQESFGSVKRSLSTLFYAMVGTFEPEVYYNHQPLSWLTTFLFILYMGLEMVVMLNMLIAIMGDTFDKVKIDEEVQIILGRASFIDACEASLSSRQIEEVEKQIGKFLYVMTPRDSRHSTTKTNWKGKINVIEENVKKAIQKNKEEMEKNIERHFEQIKVMLKEQSEEQQKKDHKLLLSIVKGIEASKTEISHPTSSNNNQSTMEEQAQHMRSFLQDDMA